MQFVANLGGYSAEETLQLVGEKVESRRYI